MLSRAILSIDAGTTGTRAAFVLEDGGIRSLEYRPLAVEARGDSIVEQDAQLILDRTLDACRAVLGRAGDEEVEPVAVALAAQRATGILWDTSTGQALVPAVVWQDTRHAATLRRLGDEWDRMLSARVGRRSGVHSVYLWAAGKLREVPEVARARAENRLAFGTIDSWLHWHLTGGSGLPVVSATHATASGGYRLAAHDYERDWIEALGFPVELLPELRQDADDFGHTDAGVLGVVLPIRAVVGDQPAGVVGLGCLTQGLAACIHGTGSFVDLLLGDEQPQNPGLLPGTLTVIARRTGDVSRFAVETYTPATGSALGWACGPLGLFESAKAVSELAATVRSAGGVAFLPALTGLRTPVMEPAARGSLSGLSLSTTRAELAYAVLEGIAHSVVSSAEANETVAGVRTTEVVVGGGLAASDPLVQQQADLLGVSVRRMKDTHAASLRGAAFLAGSGGMLWPSLEAAAATLTTDRMFEPGLSDDERLERRRKWSLMIERELAMVDAERERSDR